MKIVYLWLLIMSVFTFFLYAADKKRAKKQEWRIRESTLILCSFLGGSVGAMLGMYVLRHKTQHLSFRILIPLSLILHIAIVVLLSLKLGF